MSVAFSRILVAYLIMFFAQAMKSVPARHLLIDKLQGMGRRLTERVVNTLQLW
jgi:hypothetical protein